MSLHCGNNVKQESPPAWTQEAYCPPCSEYSFCCPILAHPPPRWLTPPSWLDWSPPGWTDPPPSWTDPPAGLTPPRLDWPPPPRCGQTENITFPILRMRAVKITMEKLKCTNFMFMVIRSEDFALGTRSASPPEYDLCFCNSVYQILHKHIIGGLFTVVTYSYFHCHFIARWKNHHPRF